MRGRVAVSVLLAAALGCASAAYPDSQAGSAGCLGARLRAPPGDPRAGTACLDAADHQGGTAGAREPHRSDRRDLRHRVRAGRGLAAENPRIDLSDTGLPSEERRTRQAIAATRRDQLLASSGREFDFQLLWTQNEVLTYAAHLADTLARSESDPARLAFVRALWEGPDAARGGRAGSAAPPRRIGPGLAAGTRKHLDAAASRSHRGVRRRRHTGAETRAAERAANCGESHQDRVIPESRYSAHEERGFRSNTRNGMIFEASLGDPSRNLRRHL